MLRPTQIPTLATRPWRLVPELDGFSDDECATVLRRLRAARTIGLAAAFPIAMILGAAIFVGGEQLLEWGLGRYSPWVDTDTIRGRGVFVVRGVVMLLVSLAAAFQPYAAIVKARIRRRLRDVSCPMCVYPLIGLPVTDGRVLCPECGGRIVLAEHGLRGADIAWGVAGRGESPGHYPAPSPWGLRRKLLAAAMLILASWIVTGEGAFLSACGGIAALSVISRSRELVPGASSSRADGR